MQVRVTGPDRAEVRRYADRGRPRSCAQRLRLGNVHDDWLEPVPSLKLDIDQDRARALGVTSQQRPPVAAGHADRLPDRRVPR